MASVTQRIKQVSQPRGGYLPVKSFTKTEFKSDTKLYDIEQENVSAAIVGMTVDYLTRYMRTDTSDKNAIFSVALTGAQNIGQSRAAMHLLSEINGLEDTSITAACRLVCYDGAYRAGLTDIDISEINPNTETIYNISEMVQRGLKYFRDREVMLDGFTFPGGYTEEVDSGDGDYLLFDTILDFKVSKNPMTSAHSLQLLMYWRMGMHSTVAEFRMVKYLAIYNPRLDTEYRISVADISEEVISRVETEVIGYGNGAIKRNVVAEKSSIKPQTKDKFSVTDITKTLGVSKNVVYSWVQRGYLPDRRQGKGKAYYFTREDIDYLGDCLREEIEEEKRENRKKLITMLVALAVIIILFLVILFGVVLK